MEGCSQVDFREFKLKPIGMIHPDSNACPSHVPSMKLDFSIKEEIINSSDSRDSTFYQEDGLLNIDQSNTSQSPVWSLPCATCGTFLSSIEELQDHQFIGNHTAVNFCDVCQIVFKCKSDLKRHIIFHEVNGPFTCRTCGILFCSKKDLQDHVLCHLLEKSHVCTVCGAEFRRHSSLANHIKIHNYPCGLASENIPNPSGDTNVTCSSSNMLKNLSFSSHSSQRVIPSFESLQSSGEYTQNVWSDTLNFNSEEFQCSSMFFNNVAHFKECSALNENLMVSGVEVDHSVQKPKKCDVSQSEDMPTSAMPPYLQTGGSMLPSPLKLWPFSQSSLDSSSAIEPNSTCSHHLDPALLESVKQEGYTFGIKFEEGSLTHKGETHVKASTIDPETLQDESLTMLGNKDTNIEDKMSLLTSSKLLFCQKCAVSFSTSAMYQIHMRIHEDLLGSDLLIPLDNVPSQPGSNVLDSTDNSGFNYQEVSQGNDFCVSSSKAVHKHICPECSKRFLTKQKLFRHLWIHRKNQFTCEVCGSVFKERSLLHDHRFSSHPPTTATPYACHECGKTFASRQSLGEHAKVHGGAGPTGTTSFWCNQCGKSFSSRQGFQIHIRTHTGEKPYGCKYCWKSFRDGGTLRKHERIHTGERPHVCPLCSRAFNQKVVLREHVRCIHLATSEPLFSCQLCNAVMSDKEEFCAHIVKHSDEMAAAVRAAAKGGASTESNENIQVQVPSHKKENIQQSFCGTDYELGSHFINNCQSVLGNS